MARRVGHVEAALAILRHCQEDVERGLVGLEAIAELLQRRGAIGVRNVEEQAVGQNAGRGGDGEGAFRQRLLANLQRTEAPGAEGKGLELEMQDALKEAVLYLKMLRAEKRALRPDDRLQSLHWQSFIGNPSLASR